MKFTETIEFLETFGFRLVLEPYGAMDPKRVYYDSPGYMSSDDLMAIEEETPVVQVSVAFADYQGTKQWIVEIPGFSVGGELPQWGKPIENDGYDFILFLDKHYQGWQG